MKRPEDVELSREEGEALLARLEANTLTAQDRQVLGEGAHVLFLVVVCAARSEAESQAPQGARVWREAQETQASLIGWDTQRRECRGKCSAVRRFTRRAICRCSSAVREEAPTA